MAIAEPGQIKVLPSLRRQIRELSIILPAVYIIAIGVLVLAAIQDRVPATLLLRDPANVVRYPPYIGLLSNVGVLLWSASATLCLFTAALARVGRTRLFLLYSGLLTALLGLDDFFLLHESVFPVYLGISEKLVTGSYAVLLVAYLVTFRREILRSDFLPLGLALFFFAWATSLDMRLMIRSSIDYLLDDGLKLIGIVGWCFYFVRTCAQVLQGETRGVEGAESRVATLAQPGLPAPPETAAGERVLPPTRR